MTPEQAFEAWWGGVAGERQARFAHLKAGFRGAFMSGYQAAREELTRAVDAAVREARQGSLGYDPFTGLHTDRDGKLVDPPGGA